MRVNTDLTSCTAFLGVLQEGRHKSPYDQDLNFYGTGFFVTTPTRYKRNLTYFVTAKHILDRIVNYRDAFLRVNRLGGLADYVLLEGGRWFFHPDDMHNDIALIHAPLRYGELGATSILNDQFALEADTKNGNIGLGDVVHVLGLFSVQQGRSQNSPIVRSGTVAMLPLEPVLSGTQRPIESYLIEVTSLNGMSGGPVFLELDLSIQANAISGRRMVFLGMLHGHWDLPNTAIVTAEEAQATMKQNVGISIVIPAHKIQEALEQPDVVAEQDEIFRAADAAREKRFYES